MKSLSVFRSASGTARQRYSYLTITALVMMIGVFSYYFYFLSLRADALDERNFRVLDYVKHAIDSRMDAYKSIAESRVNLTAKQLHEDEYYMRISWDPESDVSADSFLDRRLRSLPYYFEDGKEELREISQEVKQVNEREEHFYGAFLAGTDSVVDSLLIIHSEAPEWVYGLSVVVKSDFSIPVGALVRPALRRNVFDGYMVLRDQEIVYELTPSGLLKVERDTSRNNQNPLFSGDARAGSLVIDGREYRTYTLAFNLEGGHSWKLVALKDAETFSGELRTLPRRYLFAVFIGIIFIVLSVPFIKALIMSRTERLASSDVIFSAVSLAITISIVTILMLDGYMKGDLEDPEEAQQLQDLSVAVESKLMKEIGMVTRELGHFTRDRQGTNIFYWLYGEPFADYVPLTNVNYTDIFLVDSAGYSLYNVDPAGAWFDVSERAYFREMKNGHFMSHPAVKDSFYLDAVISKTEQEFRAIVSVYVQPDSLLEDIAIAAMSVRLKSLTNVIHHPDYGFVIFDSKGDVLFHSDTALNLNENLPDECGNDPSLLSAVNGRTVWSGQLDYANRECTMYVRPLTGTPYLIATYSLRASRDAIHGQVFGSAFLLQILLFVFYVAIIFAGLVIVRKPSRLQRPFISLSAFIPDVNGNTRYLDAVFFNLCHGVILLATAALMRESLAVIMLFFVAAPFTVLFNTVELSTNSFRDLIRTERRRVFWIYSVAVVIGNLISYAVIDSMWPLLIAQVLMFLSYLAITEWTDLFTNVKYFKTIAAKYTYRQSYAGLVFLLAFLVCILPSISFSVLAYNKEKEIQVKIAQLNFLNAEQEESVQERNEHASGYYSAFYNTYRVPGSLSLPATERSALWYDGFSAKMRQYIQDWGSDQNRLKFGAADERWRWVHAYGDRLVLNVPPGGGLAGPSGAAFVSELPVFHTPHYARPGALIRFWFIVVLSIVALRVLLFFFVSKLFLHEKYSRTRSQRFDQSFFESTKPGYKAFVTGVPSAGKSAYFSQLIKEEGRIFRIDFVQHTQEQASATMDAALKAGSGVVIIDHFEHNILDPDETDVKLTLIEKLVANKEKKVIIISAVQPAVFLHIVDGNGQNKEADADENDRRYERWSRVLAAFYDFIYPLQGYASTADAAPKPETVKTQLSDKDHLLLFVKEECDNGMFLKPIGEELMAEIEQRTDLNTNSDDPTDAQVWKDREDIVIRIQKLAENYYRSIWDNLPVEEQFVLYDLAQDGLVNAKNQDIVEGLIDKGLVRYVKRLRIMNRSFRNFILCVSGPSEIGELEKKVRQTGAWSKLKWPLLLVVCTLLLFVIKSDRSQLFGFFTAITALIPVVVGLFTVFSQFGKKE